MAPLRWGIASAGTISFDFANALTTLPASDHKIAAVGARSLESAKEFAKKFDIPNVHEGYESLAKDKDVDVIYIGSIVATHFEIAMLALENGKHVLCEKPLTLNEKQSAKLFRTAKEKKLFFMEAIWSRFFGSYKFLRQRVDSGDLGEIREIDLEFGFSFAKKAERLFLKTGGGSVLDLGVYPIQIALWVFRAEPTKIICTGSLNEDGLDMEYQGELHFPNSGVAKFKVSCLTALSNKAIIKGTKGQIELENFWSPVNLTDMDGKVKTWELPKGRYDFLLTNSSGLRFEAEETRQAINKGLLENASVTHAESLRIVRIQDKLRKLLGVHFPEDDLEY